MSRFSKISRKHIPGSTDIAVTVKVARSPNFVVVNSEGTSFFVEVKFRARYFSFKRLERSNAAERLERFERLAVEDDPDFEVNGEVLKQFVLLVKKFLMNGKAAHEDSPADSSAK
jgi:hypothetical protein